MSLVHNFIIPVIKTTFLVGIIGFIIFIVIRAFRTLWNKKWKFMVKYDLKKQPYNEDDIILIQDLSKTLNRDQMQIELLVRLNNTDKVNELMFIYDRIREVDKDGKGQEKTGQGTAING